LPCPFRETFVASLYASTPSTLSTIKQINIPFFRERKKLNTAVLSKDDFAARLESAIERSGKAPLLIEARRGDKR
jgi:hypothetical protein